MDTGTIPAELLLVLICPIHKGGSKSAPKNYRPVALTSHLIKVFERVVRRALVKHIESKNILPSGQHGSRALRSTLTQLLSHWDTILDGLEQGKGVDPRREVLPMDDSANNGRAPGHPNGKDRILK